LLAALQIAQQSRQRSGQQAILLLFTDGRANVGLHRSLGHSESQNDIDSEIRKLGRALATERVRIIVVDAALRFASQGEARQLAACLGANYVSLPNPRSPNAADTIAAAASSLRADS
jgi:Mg-chelatase subunit ChlD